MTDARDGEVLAALLVAMGEVRFAIGDARTQLEQLPASPQDFAEMEMPRRVASLALLKAVEQLEDLIARTLRATLTYEQVEIAGLSPRAIADQGEKLGMIPSSDRWSDLVRLRNRLVHEYPLPRLQQLARLTDAWHAGDELIAISNGLADYLHRLNIEDRS